MIQTSARVIENQPIAERTYRIRLEAPAIAREIQPGQFVMVRGTSTLDPLLGRPFALYDVILDASGDPTAIDVVYLVIGRGTTALAERRPGETVSVWGPLGHPFASEPGDDIVFVAGGIGQTPFLSLGRWWLGHATYGGHKIKRPARSVTMLYGVRDASYLAGLDDFKAAGIDVAVATDNGSAGHHGYVTELLQARIDRCGRPSRVIGCGPAPMLAALSRLMEKLGIPCDVSLENQMACGFGVCFSCVAGIKQADGSVDLRRVCVEGPVFRSQDVAW